MAPRILFPPIACTVYGADTFPRATVKNIRASSMRQRKPQPKRWRAERCRRSRRPDFPSPFVAFLVGAVMMQMIFGFCRAMGGVVAQSSLMSIVPKHFMGRTQSAMAILTTVVQLVMSFALGWVAQGAGLIAGYTLLALLYTGSTISAVRARQLMR